MESCWRELSDSGKDLGEAIDALESGGNQQLSVDQERYLPRMDSVVTKLKNNILYINITNFLNGT